MTSPLRSAETARPAHHRPYLRVAPEPYRRRRTAAVVSLAVIVVFGSLLASAVFHSVLVQGQLHLDDTQRRTEQIRLQVARDRVRLAELQSPANLAAAATRQGMEPATEVYALGSGSDAPVATGSVSGATEIEGGVPTTSSSTTTTEAPTTTMPRRSTSTGTATGSERAEGVAPMGPSR